MDRRALLVIAVLTILGWAVLITMALLGAYFITR